MAALRAFREALVALVLATGGGLLLGFSGAMIDTWMRGWLY